MSLIHTNPKNNDSDEKKKPKSTEIKKMEKKIL